VPPENAMPDDARLEADVAAAYIDTLLDLFPEHRVNPPPRVQEQSLDIAIRAVANRHRCSTEYVSEVWNRCTGRRPSPAEQIWNRACDPHYTPQRPGDRALHDVLRFHANVMNGGLDYALDVDDGRGYQAAAPAAEGFRVLGAAGLAETLKDARAAVARIVTESDTIDIAQLTDAEAEELTLLWERYCELLPDDTALVRMFETYLQAHPEAFEAL
jgi:hypothetical protein